MKLLIIFAVQLSLFLAQSVQALEEFEDNSTTRYQDFQEHLKEQKEFEMERVSGLDEFLSARKKYQEEFENERKVFLAENKRVTTVPEKTPEYNDYLLEKSAYKTEREAVRQTFLTDLAKWKKQKTGVQSLSEIVEYALQDNEKNRVEFSKRNFAKGSGSSGGGGAGSFGGGGRFSGGTDFSQPREDFDDGGEPPPPPPAPEFDDAETVPPPMSDDGGDDF